VSESPDASVPYRVVYSELVRTAIRELASRAWAGGNGPEVVAAVKELDRRLHLYPQFGDPIIDLKYEFGQVRIGTVPPLVVRYAVYEERRLVVVAVPPALLTIPGS
jgi:hypothetical protein